MGSLLPAPLLLLLVALAGAAELPSSLKTCKQNDPDFKGCLKKAIQDAVQHLAEGLPTVGLPPIDPLHFTQIKIEGTPERPVSLSLEFNEVDITGMGKGILDDVELEPGSYHLKAKLHTDSPLSLIGPYKADGKILVLPIKGEGNSHITAPRMDVELEVIGQPIEREGDTYWDMTDFKLKLINFNKLTINVTGLYNNDKVLADNTLKFMNENSAEVANELKPALEEALAASFKEMAKRLFDKVPYNSIFPPS